MTDRSAPFANVSGIVAAVVGRIVWACVVVYTVVTAMFVLFVLAPDYSDAAALWAMAISGREPETTDPPPLTEQYVEWMSSILTFQWGESRTAAGRTEGAEFAASNAAAVADALPVTLAYVVPATVLAFVIALALGYTAARRPRSAVDRLLSGGTYLAFSLPNFFLAAVIFYTLRDLDPGWFPDAYDASAGASVGNALWLALPGFVLVTHLIAAHFRYSRAETRDALQKRYVAFLEAKGGGPARIARHVFRNAALPLVTMFVTELVGVLLVSVFVLEVVFDVPGVGSLAYDAVTNRDLDVVMILTALFATTIVIAHLVEDLASLRLDPRTSE